MVPSGESRSAKRRVISWPGSPAHLQPRHAGEILPHVKHINTLARLGDRLGFDFRKRPHRRPRMRLDERLHFRPGYDRVPSLVVEARLAPIHRPARVVGFTHQKIGRKNRSAGSLPVRPGGDDVVRAIGVIDLQLRAQAGLLAVMIANLAPADVTTIPTVRENCPQGIPPRPEHASHVVGAVVNAFGVIGPARREPVFAHALAVKMEIRQPERGGVKSGAPDFLGYGKLLPQIRRGRQEQWSVFAGRPTAGNWPGR